MGSSPGEGVAAALSHRAEVFRSKLIEDFQILESISEQGKHRAPVYSSSDISSEFTHTSHISMVHARASAYIVVCMSAAGNGHWQFETVMHKKL